MLAEKTEQFTARVFGQQFYSTYSSFSRGVSILIPQGIPFSCTLSVVDKNGRYIRWVGLYSS